MERPINHFSERTTVRERPSDSDALFEMANLFPKHTGLPFVVWISSGQGVRHDIRVKVSPVPKALPSQMVSVALRPLVHVVEGHLDPEHLNLLRRWIELNQEVIQRYWEGLIDTVDAMKTLKPLA